METLNISFIGAGNMASSLIGGLLADGKAPTSIHIADVDKARLDTLKQRFAISACDSNDAAAAAADILVLAVKPQHLRAVTGEIRDQVQQSQPLVISIAAGVRQHDINRWLGGDVAVVRVMPNTPALIQTGASALYANERVTTAQRNAAETILRAVGIALWLDDEAHMDAVTALSGSGPAYFFLFMEAMEAAGRALGLDADSARLLTLQTAFGATKMALESSEDCATLRRRVTSPGGTTEQALRVFEQGDLRGLIEQAVTAAAKRSEALAQALGKEQE